MHEKDNYLKTAELSPGAQPHHDRRRTQQHAHPTHAPGAGRKTAG